MGFPKRGRPRARVPLLRRRRLFPGPVIPPGIPTNVVATPSSTTITETWGPPATGGPATSYDVRIDGGSASDAGDVLEYSFTGLSPQTAHTVSVRAVNAAGVSAWVDVATVTTAPREADDYTYVIEPDPYLYVIRAEDYLYDVEPEPYVYTIRN